MLMMKDNEIFMSKGDDVAFSISLSLTLSKRAIDWQS